jgi:Cdc6-like AAA superfamily ATPase
MVLFKEKKSLIFKDAKWLGPLADPPGGAPVCRDAILEQMAGFESGVFTGGQGRNLFIYGLPGTGKTVLVRYLLSEIRKHAEETGARVRAAYVNAGKTRGPYYTMLELTRQLGIDAPDSGWQMSRLKQAFENVLREGPIVVAVDEVDALLLKEKEPLVYYLCRQPGVSLILVSNRILDVTGLPARTLSTLQPKIVCLEPCSVGETVKILRERAEHAFNSGAVEDKRLEEIAGAVGKPGDLRLGLSMLLAAAEHAEEAGRGAIGPEDVEWAVKSQVQIEDLKRIDALSKRLRKKYRLTADDPRLQGIRLRARRIPSVSVQLSQRVLGHNAEDCTPIIPSSSTKVSSIGARKDEQGV